MKNMTLENIAGACGGELVLTQRSARDGVTGKTLITGVTLDSRKLEKGNLFFATVGKKVDGHCFIGSVFEKGASCVVTQKTPGTVAREMRKREAAGQDGDDGAEGDEAKEGGSKEGGSKEDEAKENGAEENGSKEDGSEENGAKDNGAKEGDAWDWGAYILVKDSFQALKDIAEFYRSVLDIPVVGITGSVGKTSTKELIASVLEQKYRVFRTQGNFNNEVGVPLMLLSIREEHEAAVLEMGISDFGEMRRLSKMVRPTVCVITNIGQCHLENLKTRDGILKAKAEIFDYMDPDGEVCLNGEDDKLAALTRVHGKAVHFFGLGKNPAEEVYISDVKGKGLFGSEAILHRKVYAGAGNFSGICRGGGKEMGNHFEMEEIAVKVPLPGSHMVINAAAAAMVGSLFCLTKEQITEGIRRVKAVNGRSRLIPLGDYTLIDDCYNANPVSMYAAIDLLNTADTGKAAILGDMFELGEDSGRMHLSVGAYAADAGIDVLIFIGERARFMYEGAKARRPDGKIYHFADKEDFFRAFSEKGEELLPRFSTVLIKASHGMEFSKIVDALLS